MREDSPMTVRPASLWAKKIERDAAGRVQHWHSLVDHSADVAACFEAALACPVPAARLAALAGQRDLPAVWVARLCVIAALHDFGKANRGFQARWDAEAPFVGHCREALAALLDERIRGRLAAVLPIAELMAWSETDDALFAPLAHHGRPLDIGRPPAEHARLWSCEPSGDPTARLAPLGAAVRRWFPIAFEDGGETLPTAPEFWHGFLGLLTFADWLGSDTAVFPLADGDGTDRMSFARRAAREALQTIGFDPSPARARLAPPRFADLSPYAPTPFQDETGAIDGRLVILESETGSGKTEAALWRFARLFAVGAIDGLYFALPTRAAAVSLHRRVVEAVARLWPDPVNRPRVTLAVPGMALNAAADGEGLETAAPDDTQNRTDARRAAHWAAERPKRFLAGTIAVGTIDQALLGAVKAKHAHLRAACLMRHLLVVDEVHASDAYMARLLDHLLRFHLGAGGHALLLSATLGASARAALLDRPPPTLPEAMAAPYPALWSDACEAPAAPAGRGRERRLALQLVEAIGDPSAIAARALEAARAGATALVIRNLRRDAVAVFRAVRDLGGDDVLLTCRGVPTLHHGRFAREDRILLDDAVTATLGRERGPGGAIVIGTQTLEQSLDIDADLLITDLCPADVLLQRLGRLHRHDRQRPPGFETPRALVLAPPDLSALIGRGSHGLGFFRDDDPSAAYPYPDLLALEATRRMIVEHPLWTIPAMNRLLVETATHPDARERLLDELVATKSAWRDASITVEGRVRAFVLEANQARLRFDAAFDDQQVIFPDDERVSSRLGARDLLIVLDPPAPGPFGASVSQIAIPEYWARGIDPDGGLAPHAMETTADSLRFNVQAHVFSYTSMGLQPG
jgi:CRISPR-associated endonuclease/helicase Cas3